MIVTSRGAVSVVVVRVDIEELFAVGWVDVDMLELAMISFDIDSSSSEEEDRLSSSEDMDNELLTLLF